MDCTSPVNLRLQTVQTGHLPKIPSAQPVTVVNLYLNATSKFLFVRVRRRKFDLRRGESNDSFIKRDSDDHASSAISWRAFYAVTLSFIYYLFIHDSGSTLIRKCIEGQSQGKSCSTFSYLVSEKLVYWMERGQFP